MGFFNWRMGIWFLVLGLLGVLLPNFLESAPLPAWPFYVLLTIGVIVTGIGIHGAWKNRRKHQP